MEFNDSSKIYVLPAGEETYKIHYMIPDSHRVTAELKKINEKTCYFEDV